MANFPLSKLEKKIKVKLKLHSISGERPYSCPICKKAYAQYANMKKHMLVHAKSKQSV